MVVLTTPRTKEFFTRLNLVGKLVNFLIASKTFYVDTIFKSKKALPITKPSIFRRSKSDAILASGTFYNPKTTSHMFFHMVRPTYNNKVFNSIVSFYSVYMVNNFIVAKHFFKVLLYKVPCIRNSISMNINKIPTHTFIKEWLAYAYPVTRLFANVVSMIAVKRTVNPLSCFWSNSSKFFMTMGTIV